MLYEAGSVNDIAVDGQRLCGLTWMDERLWFSDAASQEIIALDPRTGRVERRLPCPMVQTDLTSTDQTLLQVVGPARRIRVIDSTSGETVSELPNPRPGDLLCGLHATEAGVWLGYEDPPLLELRTWPDLVLRQSISVGRKVAGVTIVGRYIGIAEYGQAQIHLLDPRTEQIAISIGVNGNPTGLTWDGRHIWYCDYTTVQLRAIDVPGIVAPLWHLTPSSTRHQTVLGALDMIRAVDDG